MRRPLVPKMSVRMPPMQTPARSLIFCTRVRIWLRRWTRVRRYRHWARRSRKCLSGTRLGLAKPCQPDAVADIGLSALDLLDLPGVHQRRLDAGIGQRVERSLPADAGPFHQRSLNLHLHEPVGHGRESRRHGRELPGVVHRRGAGPCQANGGGVRHLVNISGIGVIGGSVSGPNSGTRRSRMPGRGGGSRMIPSRCILSMASRAAIAFSRPSGLTLPMARSPLQQSFAFAAALRFARLPD